jgi:hypothetical protein
VQGGAVIADYKSHRRIINGACRVDQTTTTTIIISSSLSSIHPSIHPPPTQLANSNPFDPVTGRSAD